MLNTLTTRQKLQTLVIFGLLGAAAAYVLTKTQSTIDQSINSWTDTRQYPVNVRARYDKVRNPYDPVKEEQVTVLACADGKVEFIQYPNDPARPMRITYLATLRHKDKALKFFSEPMDPLDAIQDPFSHALSSAIYFKLYRPEEYKRLPAAQQSVLRQIQPPLTPEQQPQEANARAQLDVALRDIDAAVLSGEFRQDLFPPITETLTQFHANTRDIVRDDAKRELAKKLLTLAAAYDKAAQDQRAEAIEAYVTAMTNILTPAQKQSVIAAIARRSATPAQLRETTRRGVQRGNRIRETGPGGPAATSSDDH